MISQGMTHYQDLDQVLSYLLSAVRESFSIDCAVLTLEDERAYRVRCHKGFPASFVSSLSIPLGHGVLGRAIASGQGLILTRSQFSEVLDTEKLDGGRGWESFLISPIILQSQNLGLFVAAAPDGKFFVKSTIDLLRPYLQVLSVGMRNVQLIELMEKFNRRLSSEVSATTSELTQTNDRLIHHVRELKALYEITLQASMHSNLHDILEAVSPKISEFFNAEYVAFFVDVSPKGRPPVLEIQYPSFGLPHSKHNIRIPDDTSGGPFLRAVVSAFKSGEIQHFKGGPLSLSHELQSYIKDQEFLQNASKVILRSLIVAPLKTPQGAKGVLVLANPIQEASALHGEDSIALKDEDLRTLTLVAIRIANALEYADLETENRKRMAELTALQEVNNTFYATPVLEFILAKIVRVISKTFNCERCDFLLHEATISALVAHPPSDQDPISIDDYEDETTIVFIEKKSRILNSSKGTFKSMMLVPLKIEEEMIGVLRFASMKEGFFDDDHVRVAELLAERSAVIVQNARLYEKVMAANRELERLNQVKTEFVSMVSHELRTPVTAIKGFVDVVLGEDAGPINEQQRKFLRIAHNSIERLSLLISDLLDVSRIESGQLKIILQPVAMDKIIQECFDTYRASIESKQINFELRIEKKIPIVSADESRVKQVIENLLSNAMKFVPQGGFIKMSIDDLGDFVIVSVVDSGVGIKKEDQEKIFSMFYQVDSSLTRKVGGTGLGLAISKAIVEMHGGRIWVESEPGRGSAFRFLIPRLREHQVRTDS